MKKILYSVGLIMLSIILVSCGNETSSEGQTKEVVYLDKTYTVPQKSEKIVVTGAMEAMEDAKILNVDLTGAITDAGKFDDLFKDITKNAKPAGEKTQPVFEDILAMEPDVILSTTKFPDETHEKLEKIATTIPVTHVSTDWDKSLILLGQLTDKEDEANKIIDDYNKKLEDAKKDSIGDVKDKNVLLLRYRGGGLAMYSEDMFANPVLYSDLGIKIPDEIKKVENQEAISLEQLSKMNPDYIFLQYLNSENDNSDKELKELQDNKIWNSLNAVKNNQAYINIIDPQAQGGTAWSKTEFLDAFIEKLK